MGFLTHISVKYETYALLVAIIEKANPINCKVSFKYYRIAKGIKGYSHMLEKV